MLSKETVNEMYQTWLRGSSLRQISKIYGIPHGSVHTLFKRQYGANACNLQAKSLVRSVVSDYETNEDVIRWALSQHEANETQYFKSKHSIQQLSNYQTLREEYLLYTVADTEDELDQPVWSFLRMDMYLMILDAIVAAIDSVSTYQYEELTSDAVA